MTARRRTEPTLRADARRNRAHVLEVARAVLAAEGVDVGMSEIARRAGVGVGTLYRQFPTKEALFAAIVAERIASAAEHARALGRERAAGDAFFAFLDRMWKDGASKKDLVDALAGSGVDVRSAAADASADLRRALADLLRRAQAEGAVRPGVKAEDVLALLAATMAAARRTGVPGARLYAIVRDGLRPPPG